MEKLTIEQLGAKVKLQYPQYASLSDKDVGDRVLIKHPEYQSRIASAPDAFSDISGDVKQVGTEFVDNSKKRSANVGASIEAYKQGKQGLGATIGQSVGQVAGLASEYIGSTFKGAVKSLLSQSTETSIKDGIGKVARPIAESDTVKEIMRQYDALDTVTKRNIDAAGGVTSLVLDVLGAGAGKGAAKTLVEEGIKTGTATGQAVTRTALATGEAISSGTKTAIGKVKSAVEPMVGDIAVIPGRIATNLADKKATLETIKQLPTQTAREAAQNGVDIPDIKYLYKIPVEQKAPLKKLLQATKDFEVGASKTNPIEIVGKPIVTRLKQLDSSLSSVGKRLGEVASNLGEVTTKETFPNVFASLKKVSGLNGLTVSKKGVLNFKNTVLATAETASDRKTIQRIFTDAIKKGTGKQKHLLRQELFEVLGGKKTSGIALTGTQERAYEAIRAGLSNVLEGKNPLYKQLSAEYRKIITPLKDMRKFMKSVAGADEDILEMSAGLLARRLTSNATSNPQIRSILRALDNATKVKGKTALNIENLQDFYNVLDKYYNIASKTGLQGQITSGVEKATGFGSFIADKIRGMAGITDPVRRKAIEKALEEALK